MTELRNSNKTILFRVLSGNRHVISLRRLFFDTAFEQCRNFGKAAGARSFYFLWRKGHAACRRPMMPLHGSRDQWAQLRLEILNFLSDPSARMSDGFLNGSVGNAYGTTLPALGAAVLAGFVLG
jgi:hypothetical protein